MSNLEHAIENALVCIENGKSFKEFAEKENDLGNLNGISATAEEIWKIAEYVKYTYCNACDVKGGLTVAKCENCYHYEACLNSLSENKGLNNIEGFACEHYKDKSHIVELPCRAGDDLYWISDENEVKCQRNAIVGIVVKDSGFEVLDTDGNIDKIGTRYAYLTREEAERALEAGNG